MRSELQDQLTAAVLSDGYGSTDDPEALLFGGLYFAATGGEDDRQAFVKSVFYKVMEQEDELSWTDAAIRRGLPPPRRPGRPWRSSTRSWASPRRPSMRCGSRTRGSHAVRTWFVFCGAAAVDAASDDTIASGVARGASMAASDRKPLEGSSKAPAHGGGWWPTAS